MFTYNIVRHETEVTVFLNGDLDIDVTEVLQDEIAPNLVNCKDIVLQFEGVTFVDSSGIGLLITLVQNFQKNGQRVFITNLQRDVQQVFTLLQLPTILGEAVFKDFAEIDES